MSLEKQLIVAKYKLKYSKKFLKEYKKLSKQLKNETDIVLEKLVNCEKLEAKYKDHALKGNLAGIRDCHIKPDLVLLYCIQKEELILTALRINSHSNLGL